MDLSLPSPSTPLPPIGDENAPPPGTHLSGKVLRPTRKTRTTFRDLTNNSLESNSTPIRVRAPRKRAATGRRSFARATAVKKVKLEMGPPPILEEQEFEVAPPFLEEEEKMQGQLDDNAGPPVLENMAEQEVIKTEESLLDDLKMPELLPNYPDEDISGAALPNPVEETPAKPTPPKTETVKKRKKTKGRNGNIYIGVINRIIWLKLQEQFGFDNINTFGNFICQYMAKVFEDFNILHQVAVDVGIFADQGLSGFTWVNGLPHPVNEAGNFIQLPEVALSEEYCKKAFEVTYDLCLKRGKFLVELASGSLMDKPEETEEDGEEDVAEPEGDQHKVEQGESSATGQSQESGPTSTSTSVETGSSCASSSGQDPGVSSDSNTLPHKEEECQETTKDSGDIQEEPIVPQTPEFLVPSNVPTPTPPSQEPISFPLSLNLNLPPGLDISVNKENIDPHPPTESQDEAKQVESLIKEMDSKKSALRQILGDISLESICSPENWTPLSTPK